MGPLVTLGGRIHLHRVQLADVDEIVNETLISGRIVDRLLYESFQRQARRDGDIPIRSSGRAVLRECGHVDPGTSRNTSTTAATSRPGWTAMQARTSAEITLSGLRGRGGGGFPTGRK